MNLIFTALLVFGFTSCQLVTKPRSTSVNKPPSVENTSQPSATTDSKSEESSAPTKSPLFDIEVPNSGTAASRPKVALVFGPSGIYSFAAVGVLAELQRMGLQPTAVVGYEYSSVPAAIYARAGQAFELEWQILKLPSEFFFTENLVGRTELVSAKIVGNELTKIFQNEEVQNFSKAFSCPSWNASQAKFFQMARGSAVKLLPFCIGNGINSQPVANSYSATTDFISVSKYLKSRGIEQTIFVSFYKGLRERDMRWGLSEAAFEAQKSEFSFVLELPLENRGSAAELYSQRREFIKIGANSVNRNRELINRLFSPSR